MSPFSLLTQLIRFGFFGGSHPTSYIQHLSSADWQQLFDESRRQAVTALLYDAILLLPKEQCPPRSILFHFTSMTQTIEHDNLLREKALESFHREVVKPLDLHAVVVKGSSLATLYPNPLHRECGDNDLYTGHDTERLSRHLETIGIEVDRKDPRHISFVYHDVDFEAHSYLLYHGDDPQWETEPHSAFTVLSSPFSAFFIAKHTEHHAVFFHKPLRMRDLVDWSLLLSGEGFDMERLREVKKGSDVDVFSELMTLYCNSIFGLNLDCQVPSGLSADDFYNLYLCCPERHHLALVRVFRRSAKYFRYSRQYRLIYGQSMFRRFYLKNIFVAIRNQFRKLKIDISLGK